MNAASVVSTLMVRTSVVLAFSAMLLPSISGAQTPAQRTVLEAFRDSVERATDSAGLAGLEARIVAAMRRNRASPFEHVRLGLLSLRQAELGAMRYFEDAAAEFQTAARLAPSWPYAWYGLGLAEYGTARSAQGPQRAAAAGTPYGRATNALSRAVLADPRFADLLVNDAFQARRERQVAKVAVMLEALRLAGQPRTTATPVLAGLGRLEREFGEPSAALRAFESWLAQSGRARGAALLEVARTRFMLGQDNGAALYFEGAAFDDSVTVRGYRDDLTSIATDRELQTFDRSAGPARVEMLRRFWGRRDAADLRKSNERLREHYRRLYYARRTFPLFLPGRTDGQIASADLPVDDRGLVYVRHGEPDDRVQLSTLGVEPNESWRYARDEGDLVVHFVARHDPEVFRLVESLLDVAENASQSGRVSDDVVSRGQEMLLRSREPLSPVYRRDRRDTPERGRDFLLAERALSRASLRIATSTDSYRRHYARSLGARVDMALFGIEAGGARLQVAYAVPFDRLGSAWLGQDLDYPLRVRLTAFSAEGDPILAMDSTVRPRTWENMGDRWLAGSFAVPLPVGRVRIGLAFEDGDSVGTLLPVRSFELQLPGAVTLSDLAVGMPGKPWHAETTLGDRVAMLPLGTLRRNEAAEVAYEILAPADVPISSQLTLMRSDDRAGVVSSERIEEKSVAGRRLVRHPLDLKKLKPGLYRLEVTVTTGRGGLARRWKEFEVR
jgi:GWxTD domain-containing protein